MPGRLSIIVVYYDMQLQIGNTLRSLVPPYQLNVSTGDYEILLLDNGSRHPLPESTWNWCQNIRYQHVAPDQASPCPAAAINAAVAGCRSENVCIMIDGARLVTPGVVHWGMKLLENSVDAGVEVRGWHLGPKMQNESVLEGYNHQVETELLEGIKWLENGYRLFEIASATFSTRAGFSGRAVESNCVFLAKSLYQSLGGFDERYEQPGGGLVNLDFFWRLATKAQPLFTLLGEGSFHQIHGGAATGLPRDRLQQSWKIWQAEYEKLSRPWQKFAPYDPVLAGHLPTECTQWLNRAA